MCPCSSTGTSQERMLAVLLAEARHAFFAAWLLEDFLAARPLQKAA